ncbi:MAG: FKBP-type peptidyl-prolyl cis-trans isomerase SlyD [Campylobacterota bacterium]|nr:FKBP-type peptidyl-prolyl cis-trans isomerase SlyD [Campylobacterota bacterium]
MVIAKNRLVALEYRLTDNEGNLLNENQEPIIYLHGGYGHIFKALEERLEGKAVGDTFCVTLSPQEAFGEYQEDLVASEALSELPEDLFVGMEVDGYMEDAPEDIIIYTVTQIYSDHAVLDANHPLAGISLTFEGSVDEIQEIDEKAIEEILEHHRH